MNKVELNQPIPDFRLEATSAKDVQLSACKGYKVVITSIQKTIHPDALLKEKTLEIYTNPLRIIKQSFSASQGTA